MYHISVTLDVTTKEAEALTAPVTRHMQWSRHRWNFVKEEDPLWYSVLLNDFYEEVHRYRLEYLDYYTEWIKPWGWCHKVILEKEQLNYCKHLMGVEPPPDDMERLIELTLHSHQAAYEAAKQGGTGKAFKRAWSAFLETLQIHELEDEYYYILGGEKGPPPNKLETVPMEVCGNGEMAVSHGGGDTPLGHKQVSWEEKVEAEEEQKSKDDPERKLPLPPPRNTTSTATATPPAAPSTSDNGFVTVQGWKSWDKRPRDPSKDPTPRQRPSKASRSPLPFPLRSESKRVANVHTIFKAALSQNRPSSEWVYDCLEVFFPRKTVEQLVYFSNVLCLSISEFHLTSACTPPGMCAPVLLPVVEAELPPLETYLHEGELETQDVCIHCIAAIKRLGVWLHRVDMTMRYNEGRANSPCCDDHKLGALLDFLLMPGNTGVSLKHVINLVVAENVDMLEVHLIKSKKLLKEASKTQTKLLTHLAKQKMTLEKTHLSKKAHDKTSKALSLTTEQLDRARTTIATQTANIVHIEALLKDCKSTEEESSSSWENSALEPGSGD